MTREKAIKEYVIPALKCAWNEKITKEVLEALEQEPTAKNNLGVDAVSRQAVLELIADYDLSMGQVVKGIHALPSVTPQEPSIDELRAEITTLQNRCYALTKGIMCVFCKYVCKYKAEVEPQESEEV